VVAPAERQETHGVIDELMSATLTARKGHYTVDYYYDEQPPAKE